MLTIPSFLATFSGTEKMCFQKLLVKNFSFLLMLATALASLLGTLAGGAPGAPSAHSRGLSLSFQLLSRLPPPGFFAQALAADALPSSLAKFIGFPDLENLACLF